jgi:hypothetical protein
MAIFFFVDAAIAREKQMIRMMRGILSKSSTSDQHPHWKYSPISHSHKVGADSLRFLLRKRPRPITHEHPRSQ